MNCPKHPNEKMTLLFTSYVCDICDPPKGIANSKPPLLNRQYKPKHYVILNEKGKPIEAYVGMKVRWLDKYDFLKGVVATISQKLTDEVHMKALENTKIVPLTIVENPNNVSPLIVGSEQQEHTDRLIALED